MKKCAMKKGGKAESHKNSMIPHEGVEMKEEKRHHSQMKNMHEKMPKGYAMGGAAKVRKRMPHCGKKGK